MGGTENESPRLLNTLLWDRCWEGVTYRDIAHLKHDDENGGVVKWELLGVGLKTSIIQQIDVLL